MSNSEFLTDLAESLTIDLRPSSSRSWILRPVPFATELRAHGNAIGRAYTRDELVDLWSSPEVPLAELSTTTIAQWARDAQVWAHHPHERVVLALVIRLDSSLTSVEGASADEVAAIEDAVVARAIGDAEREGLLWTSLLDLCVELLPKSAALESYCRAAEMVLVRG